MTRRLFRFAGVGLLATAIHGAVALAVESMGSVSPFAANSVGFAAATVVAFFGHGRWTFRLNALDPAMFARFVSLGVVGLSVSSFIVFLGEALDLPFPVVVLAIVATVPPINFLVLKAWVFQESRRAGRGNPLSLIVAGAAAVSIFPIFWGQPINHDTAWYLVATRLWLEGLPLYIDIIEVNPPLNFYYTVPAIVVANWLGVAETNAVYCVLAALIFGTTWWSARILTDDLGYSQRAGPLLAGGIALALIVPALNAVAQREHLLAILLVPWLLKEAAASARPVGRGIIPAAAVAALGICLKPYFLVFPAAIAVFHAIRTRSFGPFLSWATVTVGAVGLAYVGAVALLHPDYFRTVVPMGLAVYDAYGAPFPTVVVGLIDEVCFLAILAVVYFRFARPNPVAAVFWVGAAATLVSVLVQGTGFKYHALPAAIFLTVSALFSVRDYRGTPTARVLVGAVFVLLLAVGLSRGHYANEAVDEIARIAGDLGEVKSLTVLTPHVYAGPPAAIAIDADWASRYPANWLVPGATNGLADTDCGERPELCRTLSALRERNRSDTIRDIRHFGPDLIVVDKRSGYFNRENFDWIAFMEGDPGWAETFSAYALRRRTDRFDYFTRAPH